jgi:hypothetical protein
MSMIYEMNRVTLRESMNARPEAPIMPDHIRNRPTRLDKIRFGMTAALRRAADSLEPAPIPEAVVVGGADSQRC